LNKRGLGKGLGALIPTEEKSGKNVQEIDVKNIKANEKQPRKTFCQESIEELAQSMKEHGVLQPLILRKIRDGYEIVAGERRWKAAVKAGINKIPAVIKNLTDAQAMEIALIENLQREDLNPLEEAFAYKKLLDEFKMTQEELSSRVGKSRSQIANTVRLLNLDEAILKMILENKLTAGHGRALLSVEDKKDRIQIANKIIENDLSVRQVEKLTKNKKVEQQNTKKTREINPVFVEVTDQLQKALGTKVRLKGSEKRGKIELEYYSTDELERLLEILIN
jgi:ParB family chromosome partitioning protein